MAYHHGLGCLSRLTGVFAEKACPSLNRLCGHARLGAEALLCGSNGRRRLAVSGCIGLQSDMKYVAETAVARLRHQATMAAHISVISPGSLSKQPRKCLHTSSILADSVKRKRATKMKRHKWKKRMRLLRRRTKTSRGGRA